MLDVEEPYKTPYRYNTDPFTIAGERFNHGFTYYNLNKQDAYFNLKGKYSKMTFCVGCACEANSDVNKFGSLIRFLQMIRNWMKQFILDCLIWRKNIQ